MKQNNRVLLIGNTELTVFGFREELVERLVKDGYEVYASFAPSDFGDGVTTSKRLGCTFLPLNISRHGTNPLEELKLVKELERLIRAVKPAMIFTYTIKPNIYAGMIARLKGIPYCPNVSGLGQAFTNGGALKYFTMALYKFSFSGAQTVFFQNEYNESVFTKYGIANDKHTVLPGSGVNLKKFVPLPMPEGENVSFLFMARIIKEKGIDQYLEAAEIVKKENPNAIFYVIGRCDDEYKTILKDYVKRGIIKYEGLQTDVTPYLKKTHCVVLPTYYGEGVSNVLLEAAASGRPIITTNRPGSAETLEDNVTGFFVDARSTKSLAEKMKIFLSMTEVQRKWMGLNGRVKMEEEFDRQNVVNLYVEQLI